MHRDNTRLREEQPGTEVPRADDPIHLDRLQLEGGRADEAGAKGQPSWGKGTCLPMGSHRASLRGGDRALRGTVLLSAHLRH